MHRSGWVLVVWLLMAAVAGAQTVTINGTNSPPPTTLQSAVTANANGTAIVTTGYGSLLLDVTCATCSGGTTVNFEESADNSVWTAVYAYQVGTAATIGTTTTATGMFQIPLGGGPRSIRARVSGYSAGTVTVKGYLGVQPFEFPGINANAIQSGTWNITNVSGTVSLPTGAATAAKQPALGTAGSSSTDVLSVQGIASGTALPISAASLPLPSTAATSTKQSDGTQKTQIVDGSGNVISSASNALNVSLANTASNVNKILVTPDSVALPANQSVNVSQVGGVNISTGVGASGTGTQRVVDAASGTTGSAPPTQASYIGGVTSGATAGLLTGATICDSQGYLDMTTATTTEIAPLVSGRTVYVCAITAMANGTTVMTFKRGTGTNCGTGTNSVSPAWDLTAQTGFAMGNGMGVVLGPAGAGTVGGATTSGNALCVTSSANVNLHVLIRYAVY